MTPFVFYYVVPLTLLIALGALLWFTLAWNRVREGPSGSLLTRYRGWPVSIPLCNEIAPTRLTSSTLETNNTHPGSLIGQERRAA